MYPYSQRKNVIIKRERQNANKYLVPLFDIIKDVFNVRLDRAYDFMGKHTPRLVATHILRSYMELPYNDIDKILQLRKKRSRDYEQMFKEHPKNNLLTNISYDIYNDYINELKKLDLEIIK